MIKVSDKKRDLMLKQDHRLCRERTARGAGRAVRLGYVGVLAAAAPKGRLPHAKTSCPQN